MSTTNDLSGDNDRTSELLKSLRLLHQILMIVAGAVLAFALRTDLSKESSAALQELAAIRQLSFENYPSYVHDRYFKKEEDEDRAFLLRAIKKAGMNTIAEPNVVLEPIFCDVRPIDTRLIDYEAFLSETHRIAAIRLGRDLAPIVEQLKNATANNPKLRLTGAWFSGGEAPLTNGLRVMEWRNPPANNVASLQFIFNDLDGTSPAITVPVRVTYSVTPVKTEPFALTWARSDKIGQRLIDPGTNAVFPALKVFWSRLGTMGVEQATLFIEEQMESNKRGATLSFFGVPIDTELAVWAGPTLCSFVLFFFLLHFRRLRQLVRSTDHLEKFSWIALFPDRLSGTVAYVSLLVVPGVANIRLLWRYGHRSDGATQVGIGITVALLVIGTWVCISLHSFRKWLAIPGRQTEI